MTTATLTSPSLYVGTYAKYNNGSIKGAWVSLEGHTKDSFYEEIAELHKDEVDPEYMFQDFEGFPESLYGESGCDERLWEWLELDEDDREIAGAYCGEQGWDYMSDAKDSYCGTYDSFQEYSDQYVDDCMEIPENIQSYFDYEAFARDLEMDYVVVKLDNLDVMVFNA